MTRNLDLSRPTDAGARPGQAEPRPASAWRTLPGFLLGLLLLATGAGLGIRHAAAEGLTLATVLGLGLLVAGLALAGWQAWLTLRRLRRRWWALAVPAMLVATYLAVWTVGQAVAATFPPHPALGARTPASVGLSARAVTFPAADGVRLAGWYVSSRNGAAVVLLHGSGSTRTAVLDHAAVLAGEGYGVLLFDARGHGESAGRGMDFGWYGESDSRGAVDFLTVQPGVDPSRIGLLGLSMGGEEAIGAAGVDERVSAVVAEGATARVTADKGYLAAYGARGQVQRRIDWLTYAAADLLTPAPRPDSLRDSIVTATSRPDPTAFLLVAAGNVDDERHAAAYLRATAPGRVATWTVPGAGHTAGLRVAPADWQRQVLGFLRGELGPSQAGRPR